MNEPPLRAPAAAPPAREIEREADRLGRAEQVVGHVFADKTRLLTALTHKSYLNENKTIASHNEVLELLGDAVLSLVVVEQLVKDSPDAGEGPLTERRAAHVSAENLQKASERTGLAALVRTGRGVRTLIREGADENGRDAVPANIAADVVEAVIGAVYLDGGLAAARGAVFALLGPPPADVVVAAAHAKRVLQERLQRVFGKAPEYVVTRKDGPNHAPVYAAVVGFHGHRLGRGEGKNKRAATEEAAADAVRALDGLDDPALREKLAK